MAEHITTQPTPMNRREFLYYIWGASMTLILGGAGGAVLWYVYPRVGEGEFGGVFNIPVAALPAEGDAPQENPAGRFWLVNTGGGVMALYKVCTHLGCLYKWAPLQARFECPCHGSKFEKDGTVIFGPAPRSLDRFVVTIKGENNRDLATTDETGAPVALPAGTVTLAVDTGTIIKGAPRET